MRLLGIDFGTKRVGLAISDPEARLAFPYGTVERTTRDKLFEDLAGIIAKEGIAGIVLGLPLSHDSSADPEPAGDGEQLIVRQVRNFAQSLHRRTSLPVHLVDEYLTTQEAVQEMRDLGARPGRRKELKDAMAAVRILETHLRTLEAGGQTAPEYGS